MNALEIKNVAKSNDGFVLDDISFTLPDGCIMGLIGKNGAGKSTLIKIILNMLHKDSGTISILGKDNQERTGLELEDIGVVMDPIGFSSYLTPEQIGNIMSHTFRHWDNHEYEHLLKDFSLPSDKKYFTFSSGMKRKLGIAVAMSHKPKLLILDEAMTGLDSVIRDELIQILIDFTRNEHHSILISSHIISDLEKMCDYVAFLNNGKLLLCDETDMLLSKYGTIHCNLEDIEKIPKNAIISSYTTFYGANMIIRRDLLSGYLNISPVSLEELFVAMAKEVN